MPNRAIAVVSSACAACVVAVALSGCGAVDPRDAFEQKAAAQEQVQRPRKISIGTAHKGSLHVEMLNETGADIKQISTQAQGQDKPVEYLADGLAIEPDQQFSWDIDTAGALDDALYTITLVFPDGTESSIKQVPLAQSKGAVLSYKKKTAYVVYTDADGAEVDMFERQVEIRKEEKAAAKKKAAEEKRKKEEEQRRKAEQEQQEQLAQQEQWASEEESYGEDYSDYDGGYSDYDDESSDGGSSEQSSDACLDDPVLR